MSAPLSAPLVALVKLVQQASVQKEHWSPWSPTPGYNGGMAWNANPHIHPAFVQARREEQKLVDSGAGWGLADNTP